MGPPTQTILTRHTSALLALIYSVCIGLFTHTLGLLLSSPLELHLALIELTYPPPSFRISLTVPLHNFPLFPTTDFWSVTSAPLSLLPWVLDVSDSVSALCGLTIW